MNYPKLDDADFERAVTAIWYVGMRNKSAQCWIYQKTKLEGLFLLYVTGEVVEDLVLLAKVAEYIILQLECDKDTCIQDYYIDQIMDTDIYHSMNMIMITSHQSLMATMGDSSKAQVLREKLDNDFKLLEDRLVEYADSDERQNVDEVSFAEKTRMVCDRLDRVRSIAESE